MKNITIFSKISDIFDIYPIFLIVIFKNENLY